MRRYYLAVQDRVGSLYGKIGLYHRREGGAMVWTLATDGPLRTACEGRGGEAQPCLMSLRIGGGDGLRIRPASVTSTLASR